MIKKIKRYGKRMGIGLSHREKMDKLEKEHAYFKEKEKVESIKSKISKLRGKTRTRFPIRMRTSAERARMPDPFQILGSGDYLKKGKGVNSMPKKRKRKRKR